MNIRRIWALATSLVALVFIAGCTYPIKARDTNSINPTVWQGRLALRVQVSSTPDQMPDQSFSAPFELHGNAEQGELLLLTPLGSTAAAIHWLPGKAVLQARGETREFDDLNRLITELLGTDVPVAALFAWLNGQTQEANGWQVDLSQRNQGKILARRLTPAPPAELRLVLDN